MQQDLLLPLPSPHLEASSCWKEVRRHCPVRFVIGSCFPVDNCSRNCLAEACTYCAFLVQGSTKKFMFVIQEDISAQHLSSNLAGIKELERAWSIFSLPQVSRGRFLEVAKEAKGRPMKGIHRILCCFHCRWMVVYMKMLAGTKGMFCREKPPLYVPAGFWIASL